jgi:integrase
MSIYVEKGRNGRPTGFWKVEVTVAGKRYVERTNSHDTALRIEHELKTTGLQPNIKRDNIYKIGHLDQDIRNRLWAGQKDEEYAKKRWRRCAALLGIDTPVAEVRYARMEKLGERLKREGLSNKSVNRYMATVSKALRWAWKNELILAMPPVPRLHEEQGRIAFLRHSEIPEFMAYLYENERPSTALCLEVLLVTGMRSGELMSLKKRNIEIDDHDALIVLEDSKSGHGRTIPIPRELGVKLAKLVVDGLPDYDLLLRACHRASVEVGTKDTITPHILRHTTATILTAQGTPTLVVADLLGHRNLETTRKYAHPTREALREATRSMMLRGKLRGNSEEMLLENPIKTVDSSGFVDLQSAPFAARDIPPHGAEPVEKPKASVKRPNSNKKRTQGS